MTNTTTTVVILLSVHIYISVPTMVTIPVKACVNPSRRPSAKVSTSVTILETRSPVGCVSR